MLCPKCGIQCCQYKKIGEGNSDCDFYDTAEAKECPNCKKVFVEYYAVYEAVKASQLPRAILHTNIDILNLIEKAI